MQTKRWMARVGALGVVCAVLFSSPMLSPVGAAGGWTTSGAKILTPGGQQFVIAGINWYGFETTGHVAHGLYSQNFTTIVDEIKQYGYNTIRIPFSNEMWDTDPIPNSNTISACPSCKGKHSRDILAMIVNYAGSVGLHVILDNHRS